LEMTRGKSKSGLYKIGPGCGCSCHRAGEERSRGKDLAFKKGAFRKEIDCPRIKKVGVKNLSKPIGGRGGGDSCTKTGFDSKAKRTGRVGKGGGKDD